ncbi:MAG TPA: redoxin domain-containing protein [Gemmatimonadaceae bacterium]|jgi:peroxiredoxin|nr:redoxin domain-containing protein [Gemmatimonadaceae bacterium]
MTSSRSIRSFALSAMLVTPVIVGAQAPQIGGLAPSFTATDTKGQPQALSRYRGRWVVLEWFSFACPFTRKQYDSGNMQRLQSTYTEAGVTWLSIVSSAPGREGYLTAERTNERAAQLRTAQTAIIRDTSGVIGHLYGARNTPHMFVIDPQGRLVYAGAIDDKVSTDTADVAKAHNYVAAALDEAMHGRAVTTPLTQPYGCTVQYESKSLPRSER